MHLPDPTILLALAICLIGLATAPIERRFFRRVLPTRAKLGSYAALVLLMWGLAVPAIALLGWRGVSLAVTGLDGAIAGARLVPLAVGAILAGYFGLALLPLLQSLRGRRWRLAYAAAFRRQSAGFPGLLPATAGECAAFVLVSLSAGFCEEVVFRGFLMRFLETGPLPLGLIGALLVSSLIFGLNHAYQGAKGVMSTALTGLAFAALFVVTGSLWPCILLHMLLDLQVAFILWPVAEPAMPQAA